MGFCVFGLNSPSFSDTTYVECYIQCILRTTNMMCLPLARPDSHQGSSKSLQVMAYVWQSERVGPRAYKRNRLKGHVLHGFGVLVWGVGVYCA